MRAGRRGDAPHRLQLPAGGRRPERGGPRVLEVRFRGRRREHLVGAHAPQGAHGPLSEVGRERPHRHLAARRATDRRLPRFHPFRRRGQGVRACHERMAADRPFLAQAGADSRDRVRGGERRACADLRGRAVREAAVGLPRDGGRATVPRPARRHRHERAREQRPLRRVARGRIAGRADGVPRPGGGVQVRDARRRGGGFWKDCRPGERRAATWRWRSSPKRSPARRCWRRPSRWSRASTSIASRLPTGSTASVRARRACAPNFNDKKGIKTS